MQEEQYDVVVIGAGLSGLAAATRAALVGKKTLLLEQHNVPGGLNSFYSFKGRKYDVGLHAMTNFRPQKVHGPLLRVIRQLRLDRDALELGEQKVSRIQFPGVSLSFTNKIEDFCQSIAHSFPEDIDHFNRFLQELPSFDEALTHPHRAFSGKEFLNSYSLSKQLVDMILCAVCFYGSARPNDIDFAQLVVLFRSIFCEGLARPREGIRPLIRQLLARFRENGGEKKMKARVKKLHSTHSKITALELETGEVIRSKNFISSIGLSGTQKILASPLGAEFPIEPNPISFAETIQFYPLDLDKESQETIIFYSQKSDFRYETPTTLWDDQSGVICLSHQYSYENYEPEEGCLRITALANPFLWKGLSSEEYVVAKKSLQESLLTASRTVLPFLKSYTTDQWIDRDAFTPKTIEKFTLHPLGSVYGNRFKNYDGTTPWSNLRISGTDHGLLGIVGSMLSGILQTNAL